MNRATTTWMILSSGLFVDEAEIGMTKGVFFLWVGGGVVYGVRQVIFFIFPLVFLLFLFLFCCIGMEKKINGISLNALSTYYTTGEGAREFFVLASV